MKFLIPITLFVVTFAITGFFAVIGVDPLHDGIMFKSAMDVAGGGMLFRDTFTQYNALTTLIQAAALILFGKYLITIRLLTAFTYACIFVLQYVLYKKILPPALAFSLLVLWIFMAPFFIWTFQPWSSVYACLFLLLTDYFLILFSENKKNIYLLLAGISTALTFWTRHTVGLALMFFIFSFFIYKGIVKIESVKHMLRQIILYAGGIIITSFCFFLWLISQNALNDWWTQTFLFGYYFGSAFAKNYNISHILWNSLFPVNFYPVYIYSPRVWILLPVLSLLGLLVLTVQRLIKHTVKHEQTVLIIIFMGLASWMQYYPFIDFRHNYWAGTPMIGIAGYMIYQFFSNTFFPWSRITKKYSIILTLCIISLVCYPDIKFRMTEASKILRKEYVMATTPQILRGMRLPKKDAAYYAFISKTIDDYLGKDKKRNVVTLGSDALYGTFNPQIKNIHPLYINLHFYQIDLYPNYHNVISSYITSRKPLVVTNAENMPEQYCSIQNPETLDESWMSNTNMKNSILALPCE